jgi:hypothetical protein
MRSRSVPLAALAIAIGLALVLILAGCDSQPDPTAATATNAPSKGKVGKGPAPGDDPDMVAAFNANGQAGLVDLRFKLLSRPAVGKPVDVEFELVPAVELERLFARFQAADGLQIVAGAESEHFDRPVKGAPVKHKLTVTAGSDGIFYLTAVVLADSESESIARTFFVPLIAGQGLAELPPASAASVADPKQAPARP